MNMPVFKSDIPNAVWLSEKVEDALAAGRNRYGVLKSFGPVTGRFDRPLNLPVGELALLPGECNEQSNIRPDSLQYIRDNFTEVSKAPVYVEVDPLGVPWVSEGNHRIMVAAEMGVTSLPVEVRYFSGGEGKAISFAPGKLIDMDLSFQKDVAVTVKDDSRMEKHEILGLNQGFEKMKVVNMSKIAKGDFRLTRDFDPTSIDGYPQVMAEPELQLAWQDKLDSFFSGRIVDVRNALRDQGWVGEPRQRALIKENFEVEFDPMQVGAGRNVVGGEWQIRQVQQVDMVRDVKGVCSVVETLQLPPDELASSLGLLMIKEVDRIAKNALLSPQELSFSEFSEIAKVLKLENHGRQWEVVFGNSSLGFCEGTFKVDALKQVHSREVSNAIYSHKDSLKAAGEIAQQKGDFAVTDPALDNKYSGKVLGVTDRHVVVSLGRSALIVEKRDIDRVPAIDESVSLKFAGGKGVFVPAKSVGVER